MAAEFDQFRGKDTAELVLHKFAPEVLREWANEVEQCRGNHGQPLLELVRKIL